MTIQLRPVRIQVVAIAVAAFAILMITLLIPSGASAAECTDTWTGPSEGNWETAEDWSAAHVPTSADVACTGSGTTVSVSGGGNEVGSVQAEGTLAISGGSLKLTTSPTKAVSTAASMELSGGNLTGAGTVKVSESFSWTAAGTMSGFGKIVLEPGTSSKIETAGTVTLNERSLVNEGTLSFEQGTIKGEEGARIENSGTLKANSEHNGFLQFEEGAGEPPLIINTGTFKKTAGVGATAVDIAFNNLGTVKAEIGGLFFTNGGASSGENKWIAAEETEVSFDGGSFSLTEGSLSGPIEINAEVSMSEFTGASARINLSGGSLSLGTSLSVENLDLSAGNLKGAGTVNVSNSFSWTNASTMSGAGKVVLEKGSSSEINAAGNLTLNERSLVNEGTLSFERGTIKGEKGARIENSGTFKANAESLSSGQFEEGAGEPPLIVNTGTFKKTAGVGATGVGIAFDNQGTVKAEIGGLFFTNGGASSGENKWIAAEETEISFDGGSFSLTEGSLSGPFEINAEVSMSEVTTSSADINVSGGWLSLGTSLSVASLDLSAGDLTGAGTVNVSESFSWTNASTMSGSGKVVLEEGSSSEINAAGYLTLNERSLVNEGTLSFEKGTIKGEEGATIENSGTFKANAESLSFEQFEEGAGEPPHIVNTGTFEKTAGVGATAIGIEFDNEGAVKSESGGLFFTKGGTSSGENKWIAAEEHEIDFSGGFFLLTEGHLSGPIAFGGGYVSMNGFTASSAALTLSGGSLSLGTSLAVESLELSGGELSGGGKLNVSKSFSMTGGGTMSGSGETVLEKGSSSEINSGGGILYLNERSLLNEGTLNYTHGRIDVSEGGTIKNTGLFRANAEGSEPEIRVGVLGGESRFTNTGTVNKTAGTGNTTIEIPFENLGTLHEETGHLYTPIPITAKSSNHFEKECKSGDPVNCATGNYSETQTDFAIGGRGVGLDLTRTYSAQAAATGGSPGAFGYGWSNSFGDHLVVEGETATVVEGNGNTVPFTKSGESSFKPPAWSQETLSGNAEAGYTLTLPEQTKYAFSGAGKLESVTDRNGNKTTLAYAEAGKLKTITDPVSRKITLTYNEAGLVESAEDPMGHTVEYGYEGEDLTSVTEPGEAEPRWQFEYDGSHRITKVTNGLGGETTNEYDGSSRVISQTDPAENTLTFGYAPFHTTITNTATGSVTDERFTSNNEPFSVTRGFGTGSAATDTFSYNVAGQLRSRTDGNGHETTYAYDGEGNPKSEKDAAGDETKWTYNETHDVVSMTTPENEKTTITRDANGNPETISRPASGKTTQTASYEFGVHGELKGMTDPLERTWSFEYDSYGDRKAATDPEGDKRTWAYNEDSKRTSTVSPRGNEEGAEATNFTTTIKRDAQGRPEEVIDPLKGTTKYTYDPDGNLKTETDPNGHKTTFTYDADNEQTKVEKANGDVLETGYDGAGQVTSQTDGNKHTTTYVRNVLEEPIEVIDPLERKTTEEFDAAGNLKSKTDPSKRKISYAYDAANRLKEISYSEGGMSTVKFGHDKDGNVTSVSDGTGESSYEYDQLERMIHSKDGHGDTVGYEYNLGNEQTGITYPNGKSITRAFDKAGRLKSITDWLGHITAFAYNRDSEPKSTTFPTATGNVDEYAYDHANRISEVKMKKGVETLASLAYTRDKVGQIEKLISKGLPGAEEESFSYDENERLTKAGAGSYEYDAANNLTKAPGTTNKYDVGSQLETGTGTTYAYDEEGERTKLTPSGGPATTYKYDQAGNLSAVERSKEGETPAISESYTYDGTGLRASQTVSGATSYLTWDESAGLPLILNDGQNSYIYGPSGLPTEQISAGETPTYLHHDQLGSTRALTNATGEVSAMFTYGAYGKLEGHTGTTSLGFAGQYTDSQSGLQYLRARFYDPATGQFLTMDPIEDITRSPYGYARQNPAARVDPSGLCGASSVGGFLESFNPISEENCAYQTANSVYHSVSDITLPSTREAAEAEVGFFDGGTAGLTKYVRELLGIGNGGLVLCGSTYEDAGIAGAGIFSVLAPLAPEGFLQIASRFPKASAWLVEHGDEVTQVKGAVEEAVRHFVGGR